MKAIQTTNKGGSSKPGLRNDRYIKYSRSINKAGLLSAFVFALLALTSLFPISKGEQNTEAVTGTAQSSSLTLSVSDNTASVELDVNSPEGTFASSSSDTSAAFSVTTNNFSGYTLSISSSDDDGKLYDETKQYFLEPLTSATSEADFSSNADLNGKWGYKPSKFNSAANSNYLPAPTTVASTLDTTATANPTANDYSISLGLRADYNTMANTYTDAFVITAVPNPIAYVITYDANTTDTVSNMPAAQNSTTSATEITLSDKTPAREGYDFKGWCSVAPAEATPDVCTGLTFQPGDTYGIDQTVENITTLYTMWKRSGIEITYDANGGYFSDNTSKTANAVIYDPNITKVTKISKSSNVDDDGNSIGGYENSLSVTDVVTIPEATELHVTITYETESTSYDWVAIYDGSVTPSEDNYEDSITGKLGGTDERGGGIIVPDPDDESGEIITSNEAETKEFIIPGDTAQFYFRTDSSVNDYYGYYAKIEGVSAKILSGEALTPTRDGHKFDGWYTDIAGTTGNEFEVAAGMAPQTVYAKWIKNLTIIFNGNGNTGGSTNTQIITYGSNTNLNLNGFIKTDYRFTEWNTKPDGSGINYKDGATYSYTSTVNGDMITLYAQWERLSMQNYTAKLCSAEASAQVVTLPDTRDNKTYTVRYINGQCWMTQNLKVDAGQAMTPADTNIPSNYIMPSNDLTDGDSYTEARMHTGDDAATGNWYNYCAATAGKICQESSSVALYDICPKGWRLPNSTEIKKLTPGTSSWDPTYLEAFTPVAADRYDGGSLANSGDGDWWTSAPVNVGSNVWRKVLDYSPRLGGLYSGSAIAPVDGLSVRCVLK